MNDCYTISIVAAAIIPYLPTYLRIPLKRLESKMSRSVLKITNRRDCRIFRKHNQWTADCTPVENVSISHRWSGEGGFYLLYLFFF